MKADVFIPTQNFQKFEALCDELLGSSVGLEMAAVIGPAGRGKTTAAERVNAQNPKTIYIRVTDKMCDSVSVFYREICFKVAGQRPYTKRESTDLIESDLAETRRLLMIDEADRLSLRFLNALRDFHDVLKVPVFLLGEKALRAKLARENRLASRTRRELDFEPVSQVDLTVFYRQALDLAVPKDLAPILLRHSKGDFRDVLKDALAVEQIMKSSGLKEIDAQIVKKVCS